MKVLVTGSNGQLGFDLIKELNKQNHEVFGFDVNDMNITKEDEVNSVFEKIKPQCVIHCAAYTNVDLAESKKDLCNKINHIGTKNIVNACKKFDCKLIFLSTDYVFSGDGTSPFKPYDKRCPLNAYGYSKYLGELEVEKLKKHFIVRISWVFGINGKNFVKTMLKLAQNHNEISVVNDQIGSPTYTVDLSKLLCDMVMSNNYGTYHATNEGVCSWFDFASEIFKLSNINVTVIPVSSEEFNSTAKRPKNSRMDKGDLIKNNFSRLPTWQDALKRFLLEIGEINE